MAGQQLALVVPLQRGLIPREERADRIVDQAQRQTVLAPVAERVQQAKRLGYKVLVDYVATKTPFPMGGAVTTERYVREKRDAVLRYVKALAQALHYLKTNREGSMAIISRYARFQNREVMGTAFDAARRLYNDVPAPTTEGFDLVARELAQRNPKLRDFDTSSVVDLQFVRELGF